MLPQMLFELVCEVIRTLLVEGVSDRVRTLRARPRLQGMKAVHRHVHSVTRERLLQRLSTEIR
jgi:hypothetical protein